MIIETLKDIPPYRNMGVIINVGTKYVTAVALLSWLKIAKLPVVLIDCESQDGSFDFFAELNKSYDFYLTKLPLKKHGDTLDFIFREVNAENVFLIDSDTELISQNIIDFILSYIDRENVFGAGYVHEASWLTEQSQIPGVGYGYYHERMWIPFTCLKAALVREALDNKFSFIDITIFNDFAPSQKISQLLRTKIFRNSELSWLNFFKKSYNQQKPGYIIFDTGASIFQFLKYDKGYSYVGIPAALHADYVLHFHGVTRNLLDSNDTNSFHFSSYEEIIHKLQSNYNLDINAEDS